jgi:hypothetical protein
LTIEQLVAVRGDLVSGSDSLLTLESVGGELRLPWRRYAMSVTPCGWLGFGSSLGGLGLARLFKLAEWAVGVGMSQKDDRYISDDRAVRRDDHRVEVEFVDIEVFGAELGCLDDRVDQW